MSWAALGPILLALLCVIVVFVFPGLWDAMERKHMRDSIREADDMMERAHPGWRKSRGRRD
jgi:hypothetical protein